MTSLDMFSPLDSLKALSFLIIICCLSKSSEGSKLTCADHAFLLPFNVELMSGTWYEAMRVPPSDIPACVSVTAPNEIENGSYNLTVNYMNNIYSKWKNTTKTIYFPWDQNTQKGIFNIIYEDDSHSITFVYKLLYTDIKSIAVICGHTNFAASLSMIKIMTRAREIDEETHNKIQALADKYGFENQSSWVDQESARCHGIRVAPTSFAVVAIVFTIILFINKNK